MELVSDNKEKTLVFSSSKESKCTSSFVDGLYLLIREQHFPAVSLLLWEELPEAGRGFCSSGRLFTGQGWRQSVWEAAPSAELPQVCPVDGQVIWAPGFEEWTAVRGRGWGVVGMFFILKNGTWYVSSLEYTIKQGRHRLPLWMEERVRLQGATPSYACGLHPWGSQGPRVWSWLSQECPLGAMMSSDSTASRAKVGEWPLCLALKIKPLTFVKKHVQAPRKVTRKSINEIWIVLNYPSMCWSWFFSTLASSINGSVIVFPWAVYHLMSYFQRQKFSENLGLYFI